MDQDQMMAFLNCADFHFNDCEMEVMDLQVLLSSGCMGSQKTSLLVYVFDLWVICQIHFTNTAASWGSYLLPMQGHNISTVLS